MTDADAIPPTLDIAMLIDAAAATREDPLTRFVRSLSDDLRRHAEETIKLREELISNVQRMLVSQDPREANGYAQWIAEHAHEVGYRWSLLMRSCSTWLAYEPPGPYVLRMANPKMPR